MALFRQREERIVFQELVDMPFGSKANLGVLETSSRPVPAAALALNPQRKPLTIKECKVKPSSLTPDLWLPALLPEHLVMGASQAGVLWFFSLKDGRCLRTLDLGGVDPMNLDKLGHLDHFLLGMQPRADHRLVAVTRAPDALTQAVALYTPPGSPVEVQKANHARYLEVMAASLALQWWAIDPETGGKERLEEPIDLPERVPYASQMRMRFLVGPDGRLHTSPLGNWVKVLEQTGVRTPAPKEATPKDLMTAKPAAAMPVEGQPKGKGEPQPAAKAERQPS